MKLRYTPWALAELDDDILDYIRHRSPAGAARVKARLLALTRLIEERPQSGQRTSEKAFGVSWATPYPYIIFYEVTEGDVVIVGVRDPQTMPDVGGS